MPGSSTAQVHPVPEVVNKNEVIKKESRERWKANIITAFVLIIAVPLLIAAGIFIAFYFAKRDQMASAQRIFVYMIWRHGDRAPTTLIEKLPFDPASFPRGPGNLTKLGEEQSFILGQQIRKRYFSSGNYNSQKVFIRSTNVTRTIESAEYVLKGMGLSNRTKVAVDVAMEDDFEGNPFFSCPLATDLVHLLGDSFHMRDNFTDIYSLLEEQLEFTGYTYKLLDLIICLQAHNLSVPDWTKNERVIADLKKLSWIGLEAQFGIGNFENPVLRKLRGGSILHGVTKQISSQIRCSKHARKNSCELYFYGISAHDVTIGALVSTFTDFKSVLGVIPSIQYGANIAVELWKKDEKFFIKVLYANDYSEEPREVTRYVRGCEKYKEYCDADSFLNTSSSLYFEDVASECNSNSTNSRSEVRISKRSTAYFNGNLAEFFQSQ